MHRFVAPAVVLLSTLTSVGATAQEYPYRPIRIITAAVGGGNDFQARIVGPGISGPLGQPVVVENKPGGVIAAEVAAKAVPDGYTLHIAGGALWLTPMFQKAPYDVNRDFTSISLMVREVFVLAVNPTLPVKTTQELIALAKAKPGQLNYGSDGTGARSHLSSEIFKYMSGTDIVRVAYKGGSPAITGAIGNEVQMVIFDAAIVMPQAKAGKLRALAVTSLEPSALVPGLPTIASAGLAGYESVGITGIFAPAKTPSAIITRLNREIVRVLAQPDVRDKYVAAGLEIIASSPGGLEAAIKSDVGRVTRVIKEAGIKIN